MELIWIPTAYSVYFVIGFGLFVRNVKHIVIANRRPYLVIMQEWTSLIWVILTWLKMACLLSQAIGMLTICLVFIRITFYYQYMAQTHYNKVALLPCKLFWNMSRIKVKNTVAFIIIAVLLRTLIPLWILLVIDPRSVGLSCLDMLAGSSLISSTGTMSISTAISLSITIPIYLLFFIMFIYIIEFYRLKLYDRIGMKIEIIMGVFMAITILAITIPLRAIYNYSSMWNILFQVLNLNFMCTWIPLIYILIHNHKTKKVCLLGQEYNLDTLRIKGKEFFCEETIIFLENYLTYCEDPSDAKYKILFNEFIKRNAKYELNIDEYHRNAALRSTEGLSLVYEHVLELIQNNILPYVDI